MPWTAGVYTRGIASWVADANNNIPISATRFDTEDNDYASGLNNCLTIDGLNKPTSNLTWSVQMNWTKGSDGNIWSIARTGGSNNPKLQGSVTDASGVTMAATGGSFTLSGTNGLVGTAAAGGIAFTATAGGFTATATAGALALVASAAAVNVTASGGNNITFNGAALTGQGPVAAAMVDMTPDSSTFTGTLTGGTTSPTVTCTWTRSGKQVTVNVGASSGFTSNASTFTMTGLPSAIQPATLDQFVSLPFAAFKDNGTFGQNVTAAITHASGTVAFWLNASASAWTASGPKGWSNSWSFSYLLN